MIEQPIDPPEPTSDNPTSDEIADMVLRGELDLQWPLGRDKEMIGAFEDVISVIASYKDHDALSRLENRSELLSEIMGSIRDNIKLWAERTTANREGGMRTLL